MSRRWVFTLNNYVDEEVNRIINVFEGPYVRYGIIGREVGEAGTPHLQGFVLLNGVKRLRGVKALLSDRAHFEVARGSSDQAAEYCKKDGDYTERGSFPERQGRRSDLDRCFIWATEYEATHGHPPGSPEVAMEFPTLFVRYPRLKRTIELRATPIQLEFGNELRQWQSELLRKLEEEPDDRTVMFLLDYEGNKGKTWFIRYYLSNHTDAQLLGVGKVTDIAHMVDSEKRVYFFNVPRGMMQYFQYTIIEQLKDRMVVSPKYNSQIKFLRSKVHVVVMCNEDPDLDKMSADRFNIINI